MGRRCPEGQRNSMHEMHGYFPKNMHGKRRFCLVHNCFVLVMTSSSDSREGKICCIYLQVRPSPTITLPFGHKQVKERGLRAQMCEHGEEAHGLSLESVS